MTQEDRMRVLREWIHRLRGTLLPSRRDADLEEELRLHVAMAAEEARRRGLEPADAVRAARIEAGGASQAMDTLRDQRGLPWLDDLARDVSHGLRIVRTWATTPERQQRVFEALVFKLEMLWAMIDTIHNAYREEPA